MIEADVVRVLHLVGVSLWLGYVPCENVMFFIARSSRVRERRRRAMAWVNRLMLVQEVPGMLLVAVTGALMVWAEGASLLSAPWFRLKAVLLAVLLASEVVAIHANQFRVERLLSGPGTPTAAEEAAIGRALDWITAGGIVSFAAVLAIVLLASGRTIPEPGLWALVIVGLAVSVVFLLRIRGVARAVEGALPDA